jgi:hypothetical protein
MCQYADVQMMEIMREIMRIVMLRYEASDVEKSIRNVVYNLQRIKELKLIFHPQQSPNAATMNGQYFIAWFKVIFTGKVK